MKCGNEDCTSGKPAKVRGYCVGCYGRLIRTGSLKRTRAQREPGALCTHPSGCQRQRFAKGLCSKHYQHERPLNVAWKLLRSRNKGDYDPAWDDYDVFVGQVGQRPGEKYQLRRIDQSKPWTAANCEWREPVRVRGQLGNATSDWPAYQRAYTYLRKFGLREEDLNRMREEQHNKCPVCDSALEVTHPDTGKVIRICVDHDHKTGAVRALLHDHCNKLLGHADDDPVVLRRAADYLEHHLAKAAHAPDQPDDQQDHHHEP